LSKNGERPVLNFVLSAAAMLGSRERQEDAMASFAMPQDQGALLIVADGMGGYDGGDVASAAVTATFANTFRNLTRGPIPQRLKLALLMANHALAERIQIDLELDGMGTTLLAAWACEEGLYWCSVGDSPLMLVRDGVATCINEDHSMAPVIDRQALAGIITREEALQHPERNALLASLGGLRAPDLLDCPGQPLTLQKGDRIIAASDGVWSLTLSEIAQSCATAESLLQAVAAKNTPGQDNTSIVMLEVSDSGA